jgi:hypothetical protein
MQGGFKYGGGAKIPTYTAPKPQLSEEEQLYQTLDAQYRNLGQRLEAVGANQIADNRSFIEKIFNLPDDQGVFLDLIEVIERPMRAIQGGLIGAKQGEGFAEGFMGGLTGEDRFTGVEFLDEMGWVRKEELTGTQNFMLNMGVDIIMDPLTYISPLKMIGKLFKKGAGASSVLDESYKAISKAMKADGLDIVKATKEQFIEYGNKTGINVFDSTGFKNAYNKAGKSDNIVYKTTGKKTKGAAKKAGKAPGAIQESNFAELLAQQLKQSGEAGADFVIAVERASNHADDIKVFRTVTLKDGTKMQFASRSIEVKDIVGGAFGKNKMGLAIETLKDGTQKLVFKVNSRTKNFTSLPKEMQESLLKVLDDINTQAANSGESLVSYLQRFQSTAQSKKALEQTLRSGGGAAKEWLEQNIKGWASMSAEAKQAVLKSTKTTGNKQFYDFLQQTLRAEGTVSFAFDSAALVSKFGIDPQTADDFLELIGQAATGARKGEWFGFVDKTGKLRIVKGESLLGGINVKGTFGVMPSGDAKASLLELIPTVKQKTEVMQSDAFQQLMADETAEFFDSFLVKGAEEADGLVIRMLTALSSDKAPKVVRKLATIANKAIDVVGYAFDWSRGLANNFKSQLRRIGGTVGLRMQRQAAKLDNVIKTIADTPEKEKFIRELIEAGAKIDDTGQVIVETFTPAMADIINNIKVHASKGNTALMGTWGKTGKDLDMLAKNFQDQLNQIYKGKFNVDDAFEVVVKDGAIGVNLKSIDAKTLNKASFDDVVDVFTGGGTYKLSDEAKEFFLENANAIDEIKALEFDIIDTLKKEAMYDVANESIKGAPGYFRHSLSDQAKDFLRKQKPAARSKYIQEGIDMLTSRTYMGTVDDVNKGMKAFYGMDFDFFDTGLRRGMEDLITITARKTEQAQLLQLIMKSSDEAGQPLFQVIDNTADAAEQLGHGFVAMKQFKEEFADIYKNMTPEAQKVLDDAIAALGYDEATSAIAIHRSAKALLDNVNNTYKELPEYIKGYDKFMNLWKSVTLVTPGFHMRNLFGNMANMSFAGMNVAQQSRYATKAMGDFSVYSRLSKQLSEFSGTYDDFIKTLGKADAEAFQRVSNFFESGVSQSYAGVRDLAGVNKMVKEGGQTLPKQLVGVNFDLAEHMDDFQRYMLYQWALDKNTAKFGKEAGLEAWQIAAKADEAAQQIVAESLFDYKHFTTFEKDIMKRVFPFYTFFKNNLVFQAQTIFKNPGAIGRLGRTYKYASEDLSGVDIESMPDYMTGNMWLPIPAEIRKGDKEAIAFLKLNLPLADFTEIIEEPFKRGATSVAAPIKLLFELGAGVDSFTGAPLQDFPGQKDRMDPGSGVLSQLRNEDGDFTLSANPIMQKVANDLGLRVPREYLSVLLDVADAVVGEQPTGETLFDTLDRFGLTATKELEGMQLSQIYSQLEQLRYMQDRYEQETGQDLPTKAELGIDQQPDWMKPIR